MKSSAPCSTAVFAFIAEALTVKNRLELDYEHLDIRSQETWPFSPLWSLIISSQQCHWNVPLTWFECLSFSSSSFSLSYISDLFSWKCCSCGLNLSSGNIRPLCHSQKLSFFASCLIHKSIHITSKRLKYLFYFWQNVQHQFKRGHNGTKCFVSEYDYPSVFLFGWWVFPIA